MRINEGRDILIYGLTYDLFNPPIMCQRSPCTGKPTQSGLRMD